MVALGPVPRLRAAVVVLVAAKVVEEALPPMWTGMEVKPELDGNEVGRVRLLELVVKVGARIWPLELVVVTVGATL